MENYYAIHNFSVCLRTGSNSPDINLLRFIHFFREQFDKNKRWNLLLAATVTQQQDDAEIVIYHIVL